MKVYSGSEIRNVALVGHNDTGKTTLVSQLLFTAGATTRLGSINDGTTTTDFDPDEIERKHSISGAIAFAEWKNTKINLLDTPGFGIFLMEAKAAMRVADGCATLMERCFEQGGLSQEELLDGLKREVSHHEIFPVIFSSASHNIGGQVILDAIVSMLPAADQMKTINGKNPKGEELTFDRRAEAFPA